jgi:transcriptional regulator with XRE-family HTH domain
MSDEEMSQFLQEMFRSEDAPPLSDAVIDAFLALPEDYPEEQVQRMHARFVERLLAETNPEPVRKAKEKLPLGRWIEAARQKVKLTREDISAALGKEPSYVEQVETGGVAPHSLPSNELGTIAQLFRVHIDALRDLLLTSIAVGQNRDKLGVAGRISPGAQAKKTADTMKLALDMYLADTTEADANAEAEVDACLKGVRDYLEAQQARDLLD